MHRAGVVAAIGLLLAAAPHASAVAPNADVRVLVVPFDNAAHTASISWLGEAAAQVLADNLSVLGRAAYSREERLEAFDRLQVPATATLSHATLIRLGRFVRATHIVIGSLSVTGDRMSFLAKSIRLDSGKLEAEVEESGSPQNVFGILDRVSRRLASLPANGPAVAPRPALPVFESYIKGLLAQTTPAKVSYLNAALKLDPGFDAARLALWAARQEQGDAEAAALAASAVPEASPLYARARFDLALSLIQLKRLDEALVALKPIVDRAPAAAVMNNMGVIQLRRGAKPDPGHATYYFDQAVKLEPDDPDGYFNLGYAYLAEKNQEAAIFWLREAVRRNPADGQTHAVLGAALQASGAAAEGARERELALQLSPARPEAATRPGVVEPIPRGLERLKPALEASSLQRIDNAVTTANPREQRELSAVHLKAGRRFFEQGNDDDAFTELRRALYLSPYDAEAHLLLGRIYLRTGHSEAAVSAFKISLWSQPTSAGHLGLAEAYVQMKQPAVARTEAQKALALTPGAAEPRALLDALPP